MKILWAKTDFLHPTTRGGQIRTLEMLRQLHKQHEIHYVAFDDPQNPEGLRRSGEYSSYAYPVPFQPISKRSAKFAGQLASGLISNIPVAGMRWRSEAMRLRIRQLLAEQEFDAKVCDFLFPSINIDDMKSWVLFQHNVETVIWERHAQSGRTPAHRLYFSLQARRMREWEQSVCRSAAHVVGVSKVDEAMFRDRFGIRNTSSVATGVDLEYFERPADSAPQYDLVFVGSMDWMPNIDGIRWFLSDVMPLIRATRPGCRVAIVGRNPPPALVAEAANNSLVEITGTVPDVRPYLWQSAVSIVPLRVGGGTRLKIFEAMAAGTPVVSTTIGAEGLPVHNGETAFIADTAGEFARRCLELLDNAAGRRTMSENALGMLRAKFSWAQVTKQFEETLRAARESIAQPA